MSSIKLESNASGTGIFTIQSPSSNTNRTISLPDNTGTVLTSATTTGFPAGSVLQVVGATYATESSTTSTSYVSTGLTASITPTSSSSKIYIVATFSSYTTDNGKYTIYRGASNLVALGLGQVRSGALDSTTALTYLDSPSTTSSTTYTVYMRSAAGTTYIAVNNFTCQIVLMEIAA